MIRPLRLPALLVFGLLVSPEVFAASFSLNRSSELSSQKQGLTTSSLYDIKAADLSGDGRPDLVVGNFTVGRISVRTNDGAGNFGVPVDFFDGNPVAIELADFDGDGAIDIAAANFAQGDVTVRRNLGGGTFDAAVHYAVGPQPRDLVSGDFDGDGLRDLAVACADPPRVALLRGRGEDPFDAPISFATPQLPKAIAAGDVDGDGRADLALADYSGNRALLYRNEGDFAFTLLPQPLPAGTGTSDVLLADLDADGKLDLVAVNENATLDVWRNEGVGVYGAHASYAIGHLAQMAAAGDLDGDGLPELLVVNFNESQLQVLRGTGGGGFGDPVTMYGGDNPRCLTLADFDGDGDPDVATGEFTARVTILSDAAPFAFRFVQLTGDVNATYDLLAVDLDGDARPEILKAAHDGSRIAGFKNSGTGSYTTLPGWSDWHSCALATSDFDHDGRPDVISANCEDMNLSFRKGLGSAQLGPRVTYATGGYTRDVVAADFDGDGNADIAAAGAAVYLLRGLGDGTFGAVTSFASGSNFRSMAAGDLDGDGLPDLALVDHAVQVVRLYHNAGGMTFTPLGTPATDGLPNAVTIADLDLDGRADLLVATDVGHVDLIRNLGGGDWAPLVAATTGPNAMSVDVADFDGDGRPDVLTGSYGDGNARVFNVGDDFAPRQVATMMQQTGPGWGLYGAMHADVDGDGRPDFLAYSAAVGSVTITTNILSSGPLVDVPPSNPGRTPEDGVVLERAAPNPAARPGPVRFTLAQSGPVRLAVYDVRGRVVRVLEDGVFPAGAHQSAWDGRDDRGRRVAPGLYFYRLVSPLGTRAERQVLTGGFSR